MQLGRMARLGRDPDGRAVEIRCGADGGVRDEECVGDEQERRGVGERRRDAWVRVRRNEQNVPRALRLDGVVRGLVDVDDDFGAELRSELARESYRDAVDLAGRVPRPDERRPEDGNTEPAGGREVRARHCQLVRGRDSGNGRGRRRGDWRRAATATSCHQHRRDCGCAERGSCVHPVTSLGFRRNRRTVDPPPQ